MNHVLYVQPIRREEDLVRARRVARDVAGLVGFDASWQTRIATAVSEIARNAFRYGGGGDVEISARLDTTQALCIRVVDAGPGIPHLDDVMMGRYRSSTGMGMGIVGTRRLVDEFEIETAVGRGTEVVLAQSLPPTATILTLSDCKRIEAVLLAAAAEDPFEEIQRQNRELLATLDELRRRTSELDRLNAELEDTNRGVMALYAELDDRAESLRRASEAKTSFLSNMTHEFRTPLNSVLSLAHMLLDGTDGSLTAEQERQVTYIRRSAEDLSALVNDLLDLAKVEAGKIDVRPGEFDVAALFGALKGVLRPLNRSDAVALRFDESEGIPPLSTDEGKLSQILRNLISNALKYTDSGEIRVRAAYDAATGEVAFTVRDTGIGIAQEDQLRIFDEFTQIDGPAQRRTKGTGLGLPLSRRLAELLGGRITVESELGVGSTFTVVLPARFGASGPPPVMPPAPERSPVLVLDDDSALLEAFATAFRSADFDVVAARSLADARAAVAGIAPVAVVMDVLLKTESAWSFLAELRSARATEHLPVLVVTHVENRAKALVDGATDYAQKPVDPAWVVRRVEELVRASHREILVIDDDEVARYVLRDLLNGMGLRIVEASSGSEGLVAARGRHPDAIVLDLEMPDLSGDAVLAALKADEAVQGIPVVIYTSEILEPNRRAALSAHAAAIVAKHGASRDVTLAELRAALETAGLLLPETHREVSRG